MKSCDFDKNDFIDFDKNDFIDIDTNKYFETTINNLKTQYDIIDNKNMCTSIAYYVALNLDKLVNYYNNNEFDSYRILYSEIINMGSERKLKNSAINYDGEYIDANTILNDFPEIYDKIIFNEYIICDFIADFIQNWLEDNIKPELYDNMKKTVENYTNKQEFDSSVTSLFEEYLNIRANSFEEQISKTEE
jgi:hypothetical protein